MHFCVHAPLKYSLPSDHVIPIAFCTISLLRYIFDNLTLARGWRVTVICQSVCLFVTLNFAV